MNCEIIAPECFSVILCQKYLNASAWLQNLATRDEKKITFKTPIRITHCMDFEIIFKEMFVCGWVFACVRVCVTFNQNTSS